MAIRNPGELFQHQLSAAYSVEQRILRLLPLMDQYTDNPQLKQLAGNHLAETERQVMRLEECFRMMGLEPVEVRSHAFEGLQADLQLFLDQAPSQEMLSLYSLDFLAQVEALEIATYRSLLEKARSMGESACQMALAETLAEEEGAARRLDQLALRLGAIVIQRVPPQ